jgi:hypothetical protein
VSGFSLRRLSPIVGLVIGLALGLVYTWVIAPVELINTQPVLLRTDYRRDWVRLAALSYVADGNLERARARLDGLRNEDVAEATRALIEEFAAGGRSADTLRHLTILAQALNVHTPAMLVYLHTPGSSPPTSIQTPSPMSTSTPTPVPTVTSTARPPPTSPPSTLKPTLTPTPAPHNASSLATPTSESTRPPSPSPTSTPPLLSRLQLAKQEQVCQSRQVPHIEVIVRDENGAGLSGVRVWLTWPGGADRAITGLKPQRGAGYADFNVEQGVTYALSIGELGIPLVTDLMIEPCPADEDQASLMGSWLVVLEPQLPDTD